MNLCIDIGNTRVKLALFSKKGRLKKTWVIDSLTVSFLEDFLQKHRIKYAILSSVRKGNKWIRKLLEKHLDLVLRLSYKTPLPIKNSYKTPKTLGNDRLAAVVAAQIFFPKQSVLCVDAGTCITYDFITGEGQYLGGSILPGISMRFEALEVLTAKLPRVKVKPLQTFIGNSTKSSIRTGVLQGVLHELSGFQEQYSETFGEIITIVTGGDASYFESQFKNEIFAKPDLVLYGLNQILNYNVKQKKNISDDNT